MRVTHREQALPVAWLKPPITLGFLEHLMTVAVPLLNGVCAT
jgi:hypothetical protein